MRAADWQLQGHAQNPLPRHHRRRAASALSARNESLASSAVAVDGSADRAFEARVVWDLSKSEMQTARIRLDPIYCCKDHVPRRHDLPAFELCTGVQNV